MNTFSDDLLKSPWAYFSATFLWTWSLCGVLIFTDLASAPPLAFTTLVLAILGPGVTGILFTYWTKSKSEIRDYWHRVVDFKRVNLTWWAIVVGLPFLLQVLAGAVDGLAGGEGLHWGESAPAFFENPATQLLSLFTLTLIPFFEELGWRGYAQDALQRTRSALGASLILGCAWSLWHLPASFIPDTYQAGLGIGTIEFWLHFVGIVLLSVIVSWIYINTNRSILVMIVFHATVNMAGELIGLSERGEVIYTLCWASAAAAVVLAFGRNMQVGPALGRRGASGRAPLILVAAFGLPLTACAQDASQVRGQQLTQRFRSELQALHNEHRFPGATAAYVLRDGTVGQVAVGLADIENQRPMEPETTMLAASVGKMFVSATALALVEEGRLNLDDPVSAWLEDPPWIDRLADRDRIALRHLLNHTSGLPNHVESASFARSLSQRWRDTDNPMSPDELVAHALDQPLLFAPGTGWSYSDTGYIVAGLIIERAAGRPYYEEVTRRFLEPLEFHSTVPSNRLNLPRLATGYVDPENAFGLPGRTTNHAGVMVWHPGVEWTGGGLLSSPGDLVRWARVLFEGEALRADYIVDLLAAHPLDDEGHLGYGLGVAIRSDTAYGAVLGHGGWIPGYVTSLRYYADLGIGVAFQVNTDIGVMDGSPSAIDQMEQRLARVVIQAVTQATRGNR